MNAFCRFCGTVHGPDFCPELGPRPRYAPYVKPAPEPAAEPPPLKTSKPRRVVTYRKATFLQRAAMREIIRRRRRDNIALN